jgi:hypothetical protein
MRMGTMVQYLCSLRSPKPWQRMARSGTGGPIKVELTLSSLLRVGTPRPTYSAESPAISRSSIGELGCCRVVNYWGRYRVSAEAPLPKHERISRRLQVNRQRWAELQKQWREAQP